MTDEVPRLYERREVFNVREKNSDAVRTNFAAHPTASRSRAWRAIRAWWAGAEPARRRSLHAPVQGQRQDGLRGDVWQWPQTTAPAHDDQMPRRGDEHRHLLDDVSEFNGPLMFIPAATGRRRRRKHDLTTTSYPLWTVDNDLIAEMIDKAGGKGTFDKDGRHVGGGIVSPHGTAGR